MRNKMVAGVRVWKFFYNGGDGPWWIFGSQNADCPSRRWVWEEERCVELACFWVKWFVVVGGNLCWFGGKCALCSVDACVMLGVYLRCVMLYQIWYRNISERLLYFDTNFGTKFWFSTVLNLWFQECPNDRHFSSSRDNLRKRFEN